MDYYHDRRPNAATRQGSTVRDGRPGETSMYSTSRLDTESHRYYPSSSPRSNSYSLSHLGVDPSRYDPPPAARSSSYSSAPRRSRSRARWPPAPFVESEGASLAREYRPRKGGEPDPPCRGSIDQDPLMMEVNPPKTSPRASSLRPEDRTAASQRRRGKSPVPPPIRTDVNPLPEFGARKPRPYNGAGASDEASKRTSAEFLLSPQRMTPTRSASFAADNVLSGSYRRKAYSPGVSPARSPNTYPQPGQSPAQRYYTTDESDVDASDAARLRTRSRSTRYSFTKAELVRQGLNKAKTTESSDESLSERASKLRNSGHRSSTMSSRGSRPVTPTSDTVPQTVQQPRPPPPSALSRKLAAQSTPDTPNGSGIRQGYVSGDDNSQSSTGRYPYSPPHSPKLRAAQGTSSPLNPASRAGSRQNSRPTTPLSVVSDAAIPPFIMFEAVSQKLQSPTTVPSNLDSRTRNASRLSSTMRADSIPTSTGPRIDVQSPSPQPPAKTPLPYPEMNMPSLPYPSLPYPNQQSTFEMPSEAIYQFQHPTAPDPVPKSEAQGLRTEDAHAARPQRPTLMQRHSCAEGVEQGRNDMLSSPMSPTRSARVDTTKLAAAAITDVAQCPRSRSSKGHNDWTTLSNNTAFNICPQCMDSAVKIGAYRTSFMPVQRSPNERIKCDLSRPWMRLAWLLTIKQQRPDLELLYAVSSVSKLESECPGNEEEKRSWYGVFGDDDEPIPDFYMCARDRRYVGALFPSLKDCIDRVSRSAHVCSLDRGSGHFVKLLDQLVEMDEAARRAKRSPDIHGLQELVQTITVLNNMPKCPKDNLVMRSDWHYLTTLPEFTVCPRCFIECVAPHIRSSTRASPVILGLPLADQFLRTAQPLAREQTVTRGMGSSCQLYSPRMRRIWLAVVEDNDEKYLVKKARERKAVEMGVYETYAALDKMMAAPGYDKAAVKEELDRVHKDWKEVE